MSLANHIEQLRREQGSAQKEIETIEELQREFPDLETTTDRWGRVRYMAKSANARVNQILFHRNCGCCPDSPVHARPYLKLNNGTHIYSNPCDAMIGEPKFWGGGFIERLGWRRRYTEAGINPEIIRRIENYIEQEKEDEGDDCND